MSDKIKLQEQITKANDAYRTGSAIITDDAYDKLVDDYTLEFGEDDFINKIGVVLTGDRMQTLPIPMGSMNKIKTIEEYRAWLKSKGIPGDAILVATGKYDGLSLVVDEENTKDAWTRGDGVTGQYSKDHLAKIGNTVINAPVYTFGEAIMKRATFEAKYAADFANGRNFVSGLLNSGTIRKALLDVEYVRYGIVLKDGRKPDKIKQLELCNKLNTVQVPFKTYKASEVTTEILTDLFFEWSKEFELDGIIIEVNDATLRESLGLETSKPNPAYARAFKGDFEEVKETTYKGMTWNVSKNGKLAPVLQVEPVNCDGANVSNVTLCNARMVQDLGIIPGSRFTIKRSGMVIPKIVEVLTPGTVVLPTHCPVCNEPVEWNKSDVDLMCVNDTCPAKLTKKIYAFFETIKADNCGEGTLDLLIAAGYDTIEKILALEVTDFEKLDRMGKRKAKITFDGIHTKLVDIKLPVIQHASSFFLGLGSKKLSVVEQALANASGIIEDDELFNFVSTLDGFSTTSAKIYVNGIQKFRDWIQTLPVVIKYYAGTSALDSTELLGKVFVFTGYRPPEDLYEKIEMNGGEIANSVSKACTHLVMKMKGSGSSKETKAIKDGKTIMDKNEFETLMNTL